MLKPCPFCGGEAAYYASKESVFRAEWTGHIYHCTKCQGRVQNTDRQIAQSMWNTRAAAQPPLPGTREEVAQADREALDKIERRDVHWISSFEAEGKIVLQIDELNMRSLVLGPAGEIARTARADRALPPAPMPERETIQLQARPAEGGDWTNIYPAQLQWMAKEGNEVRAIDAMPEREGMRAALEFYADARRYEGPNLRAIADDKYQPPDLVYRLDVTRDNGRIARAALASHDDKEG